MALSDMVTQGRFSEAERADMDAWAACITGAEDVVDYVAAIRTAGFADISLQDKAAPGFALEGGKPTTRARICSAVGTTEKLLRCPGYTTTCTQNVPSNLAKNSYLWREVISFSEGQMFSKVSIHGFVSSMVTKHNQTAQLRKLGNSFVTPITSGDRGEPVGKRARLSSPLSPHVIANLRTSEPTAFVDGDKNSDSDDEEVEFDGVDDEVSETDETNKSLDFNVLIPEKDLLKFIRSNFLCKECQEPIREQNFHVNRVGCACNLFWNCGNKGCTASGKILSRVSTVETSGKFKQKHPELPSALGDYDVNRQVVLACQQSGGGARMAATFCCVLSISRRSTWKTTFFKVEELIGKAQIRLGKILLNRNL